MHVFCQTIDYWTWSEMSILPVTMKALCRATGALSQAHPIMVQPTCLLHGFRRGWFRALCLLQLLLVKPFAWLGINGNLVVENSMLKTMISAKSLDGFSLGIWRTSGCFGPQSALCWVLNDIPWDENTRCFTMFHPQRASPKSLRHWNSMINL